MGGFYRDSLLKTELLTRLKLIYLKKKNPNVFDSTGHHQGKKIPSTTYNRIHMSYPQIILDAKSFAT